MYNRYIKRALDLLVCIIAMPFLLLALIPIAIAIKIEDRGPIFYCADRLGRNAKTFKMYKLRSMKVNAPDMKRGWHHL